MTREDSDVVLRFPRVCEERPWFILPNRVQSTPQLDGHEIDLSRGICEIIFA